jgi:hypothetical protein
MKPVGSSRSWRSSPANADRGPSRKLCVNVSNACIASETAVSPIAYCGSAKIVRRALRSRTDPPINGGLLYDEHGLPR